MAHIGYGFLRFIHHYQRLVYSGNGKGMEATSTIVFDFIISTKINGISFEGEKEGGKSINKEPKLL